MGWRVIGKPIATADISTPPAVYQKITLSGDILLKSIHTGIILYNDPAFTSIAAQVWSNRGSAPMKLIATSSSIVKSRILTTEDHCLKYIGFQFSNHIPLKADSYHIALLINGYTGNDSSHIAWKNSYPNPQYDTGLTVETKNADNSPFDLVLIGDDA